VVLSLQPALAGRPVPARFLGLSFEVGALAQLTSYATHGDFVRLLRSLGPGVLRFGGITADENVAWSDAQTPRPAWASATIGPADMHALGTLARRSGWSVLLTVGMAHFEPQAAAREVASAEHALGRNLAAVEFGNEPDAYGRHGFRQLPWLVQGYEEEVGIAREAIARTTPGIAVAGPDVSGSSIFGSWGYAEAQTQQPLLLTGHHYPMSCTHQPPPSIELLLSPAIRGRAAQSLHTYVSVAAAQQLPVRIDETNSVSCGGVSGVSDTFAGALWATGYAAQAMAAGAIGINMHGHPNNCAGYSPLCAPNPVAVERGALRAQPDWYALLLTRSLIGYRPAPTLVSTPGAPDLVATGFVGPRSTIKLLLSDDDPPGAAPLALRVAVGGGMGAGSVERLTAPSPQARSGVLLTGRTVAADGSWHPGRAGLAPDRGGYVSLSLPPSSAALLTVERATRQHSRRKP
ncbi:MAG: glycosyl hydrolase family 79 C-terminal domain-containing protein, partial [Solirubrobacteraceae bacterium]